MIFEFPESSRRQMIAIREVMKDFNLTLWSGDPCMPAAYTWAWITCATGIIPARITELYLDNNALTGPVLSFSSLKNLTVLGSKVEACKMPEKIIGKKKSKTKIIIEIAVPSVALLLLWQSHSTVAKLKHQKVHFQRSDLHNKQLPKGCGRGKLYSLSCAPQEPVTSRPTLSWKTRLRIPLDAAQGMQKARKRQPAKCGRPQGASSMELAMKCVERSSDRRPNMSMVVAGLREAIQLDEEDGSSLAHSMLERTGLNIDTSKSTLSPVHHTDENGINWTPDDSFITSSLKAGTDAILQRLRYFPDTSRKHCYALPVLVGENYILRPWFYYDRLESTLAEFEIMISANTVVNLSIKGQSTSYYEFVVKATNSTLDLCLGTRSASPANIPFISAIELRRLPPGMRANASDSGEVLVMSRRINLGGASDSDIRYPDDPYDRIWRADNGFSNMRSYPQISTNATGFTDKTYNKPPPAVMRTAITSTSVMVFEFPANLDATKYYVNFYFAEFGNSTRDFVVQFNRSSFPTTLTTTNVSLQPQTFVQMYFPVPLELSNPTPFSFVPAPNGSILNAAELFKYMGDLLPGTEPDDGPPDCLLFLKHLCLICFFFAATVIAIREVMNDFNLSGWSGDPCRPVSYTWRWITCATGIIPARITELYLDNNALTGPVPSFSSLKNLTVLGSNVPLCAKVPEKIFAKKKSNTKIIVEIAVPCVALLLVGAGIAVCLITRRPARRPKEQGQVNVSPGLTPQSPDSSTRKFTFREVTNATNNFQKVVGEGSFGPVYYGHLSNGVEIAVKVLSSNSRQGHQEFKAEGSQLMLVYEFLSNGTLREHLYGTGRPTLSWKTRLRIALDAAQGLEYLHSSCNQHIIHRDVKTTNILLSYAMVAKVSDFGLSKLYDRNYASHVSTDVKGTPGYLDPEYHSYSRLTEKSDVYSFGIVLFEIVCAREPIKSSLPEDQVVLSKWACKELEKGNLRSVMDERLSGYKEQAAWKILEVAMKCVEHSSDRRPSMSMVTAELREAIHLEEDGSSLYGSF
ncbi:leucine-rich repeat receptor-like serine/threonine-protein kinase At2g14510 [Selaginella moellendorffii]|uniref:leucine-rich repeat receptor-like serine/threonine-protein kinase At2g14510 n=1 Tax=Selaginella moellendorffii TaxID=88036 RepID=UPI000D1CDA4F|nr:leucine-rich repeat receptor-like serine/threonine-protein kinase At2g14510 [Selaginella moellendorffii]|eukprot:XP_024533706.1 leucine-rich repeat receptor-like serine/threonine-protein kinase At2g14510 [Selaginella moellendorffii]